MGFISCLILQLIFVLQLQTIIVLSQNIINGTVPVGESLIASESQQFSTSWRSLSGDFAFGFRKVQPNDGFTLSIWFDKIHDKTIVWHVQTVNTTTGLVPAGSKVTLTANRGLVLTDPTGQQLWRSLLSSTSGSVSRGQITDVGNFGLFSEGTKDSGEFVWSSFANPTDTLLPNQNIVLGGNLSSRMTETSFKKGRFRLSLRADGDLQLLALNSKTLDESKIKISYNERYTKYPNPGSQIVFNQSGYLYVLQGNSSRFVFDEKYPVPSTEFYHRVVLHFDGVLAQYYHPKGQGSNGWVFAWAEPDNICDLGINVDQYNIGNMPCGLNNICILGDTKRPSCECPEKFVLKDPTDEYGDCKPDFEMQTCGPDNNQTGMSSDTNEDLYEFITLERTNWPLGSYMRYLNYDRESCKASCLKDCFCAAVVFGTDRVCWKKMFPLAYGERSPKGVDGMNDSLLKVRKRAEADVQVTGKRVRNREWLIIVCSVLFGTSAFVNFIFFALYKKSKKMRKNQARDIGVTTTGPELNMRVFTYGELMKATGNFKDELGRGAFGIVYKGILKITDGSTVFVAVKKLDRIAQENEKEFMTEVKVIGQIHHKNLVKLIGFCSEGQNRMIVYEFLSHGTLASFLFKRPRPSWEDRRRIAVSIASGILYLHEECSEQIIHCDIKPQNILLDEYYRPRISDFGLAKLLMINQTNTLTNIRGTKGYVAAEWFRNSPITPKVDVYSYGVMLLEIVCCKKAVDLEDNMILIDWAYDCFKHGRLEDLIEGDLEAMDDMEMVEKYVRIAIWCIQEEPGMRPNIKIVTHMLEGVSQVHDPPNPSPYSTFSCYESLPSPVARV